jgi:hypothetical protein
VNACVAQPVEFHEFFSLRELGVFSAIVDERHRAALGSHEDVFFQNSVA